MSMKCDVDDATSNMLPINTCSCRTKTTIQGAMMEIYGRVEAGLSHWCACLEGHNHSNNKPALDDLLRWHDDVDGLEVMTQVMAYKDAARVHQVAQLQVGLLHGGQVVGRHLGVQIARHLHSSIFYRSCAIKNSGWGREKG